MVENKKKALLTKAAIEPDFDEAYAIILKAYETDETETADGTIINCIPNVPKVRAILGDFEYKEIGLWIITENIPHQLYELLEEKGLFPYCAYGENFIDYLNI